MDHSIWKTGAMNPPELRRFLKEALRNYCRLVVKELAKVSGWRFHEEPTAVLVIDPDASAEREIMVTAHQDSPLKSSLAAYLEAPGEAQDSFTLRAVSPRKDAKEIWEYFSRNF
jgi:hypothetical protein